MLSINIDTCTSNHVTLVRTDLNVEYDTAQVIIRRYNKQYNHKKLEKHIIQNMGEIETDMIKFIHVNNIGKVVDTLNMSLQNAHKITKMKEKHKIDIRKKNIMEEVNEKFINFRESLKGGIDDEVEENIYTTTRKKVTYEM